MLFPKISIVTPNKNGGPFLEACICSIVDQRYPNLEYIIIDGGSTDSSIEIIKKYEDRLSFWTSENDSGQGAAIDKGFKRSTGEIMCWLNSDDMFHPGSLEVVARIFSELQDVDWIMGFPSYWDKQGNEVKDFFINQELTPRPPIFTKSMHQAWARWSKHRYYNGDILAIQQESVFWRRSLWEKAGNRIDISASPAIDFELWMRFFDHAQLHTVLNPLGGFRFHSEEQISIKSRDHYLRACNAVVEKKINSLSQKDLKNTRDRWRKSRKWKPFFYFGIPFLQNQYSKMLELPTLIKWDEQQQKLRLEQF